MKTFELDRDIHFNMGKIADRTTGGIGDEVDVLAVLAEPEAGGGSGIRPTTLLLNRNMISPLPVRAVTSLEMVARRTSRRASER